MKSLLTVLMALAVAVPLALADGDEFDADEVSAAATAAADAAAAAEAFETVVPTPTAAVYYESFQSVSRVSEAGFASPADSTGTVTVEAPKGGLPSDDKGLLMNEPARHYKMFRKLDKPLKMGDGQPLVFQFEVWQQDGMTCGGSYMKLLLDAEDPTRDLSSPEKYAIMFGPDKCPPGTDKVHLIIRHQHAKTQEWEEKHLVNAPKTLADASVPHLYTLVLSGDGKSYTLRVDGEDVRSGLLLEDFSPSFQPPKTIKDPSQSKPADWVDDELIPDPEATKPEGWDDAPEFIADPEAEQPEEWDEEEDGEWEAPMIQNPEYNGEWSAPMVKNPDYRGPWVHPEIDNPNYYEEEAPGHIPAIGAVAIDLWTMSGNLLFDNLLLGRSEADAAALTSAWRAKATHIKESSKRRELAQAAEARQERWDQGEYGGVILDAVVEWIEENQFASAMTGLVVMLTTVVACIFWADNGEAEEEDEPFATPAAEEEFRGDEDGDDKDADGEVVEGDEADAAAAADDGDAAEEEEEAAE